MLSPETISLICPCNDLESKTILDIARAVGCDVHQAAGSWGLTLAGALAQIVAPEDLREHVVMSRYQALLGNACPPSSAWRESMDLMEQARYTPNIMSVTKST
jgi:hypothetical protein